MRQSWYARFGTHAVRISMHVLILNCIECAWNNDMMQESAEIDAFDLKLLALLDRNGALTNQQLAQSVALSASQCSRRRARLENLGIIRRYRAELNAPALGFGVTAFVRVALAAHSRENARRFRDLIIALEPVQEAHSLTGEADYLLKVIVRDLAALSRLLNDELLPHEAVATVRSSIVLDTLKGDGTLPLKARR